MIEPGGISKYIRVGRPPRNIEMRVHGNNEDAEEETWASYSLSRTVDRRDPDEP